MLEFLLSIPFIIGFTTIAAIIVIVALEKEEEGWASGLVSLALALVLWKYGKDTWVYVNENILTTIYFTLGYVSLGIVWSFLKWNEKIKAVFKNYTLVKNYFIEDYGEITDENIKSFGEHISSRLKAYNGYSFSLYEDDYKKKGGIMGVIAKYITPKGEENKALIVSWIMYWPLSLLGTLLNNPFRRFFNYVYESLSGVYDKITERHMKDAFIDN